MAEVTVRVQRVVRGLVGSNGLFVDFFLALVGALWVQRFAYVFQILVFSPCISFSDFFATRSKAPPCFNLFSRSVVRTHGLLVDSANVMRTFISELDVACNMMTLAHT